MVMIVLRPAVVVQQRQPVEVFFNRGHLETLHQAQLVSPADPTAMFQSG